MLNLLASAIGIGLIYTVVLTEAFGLAAGGLVVPGYMAVHITEPLSFGLTLVIALGAFVIVRGLGAFLIVFGRRRTALMIVTGYLLGALADYTLGAGIPIEPLPDAAVGNGVPLAVEYFELGVVGYIIPGLIALWFDRQGITATVSGLVVTAVLVRLTLIVVMPEALEAYDRTHAGMEIDWRGVLRGLVR